MEEHDCEYIETLKHVAGTPLDQWITVEVCWTCGEEKPRWVDLLGIDPDFTGGKPIDEFLRESRGEA